MIKQIFNTTKPKKFEDPTKNLTSTEFEVNNWEVSDFVVKKLVPVVSFHPFPLNELMLMTSAVCYFKPEMIFEWGTNIGKSARIFYEIKQAFNIQTEIHSIDLPNEVYHNEHPKNDRGIMVKGINEVNLHQGDGLEKSFEIIDQKKPKGKILFFVDGDHSYASVKKELETILEKAPEAVVLLHDTFYQSDNSNYNIGPFKALQEVTSIISNNFTNISVGLGLPGMSLIYKK